MKLLRVGAAGEKPAALDAQGRIRDVSALTPDLTPEWLAPQCLKALATIDLTRLSLLDAGVRIGVPVAGIRQFVAIGLNYHRRDRQHAGAG